MNTILGILLWACAAGPCAHSKPLVQADLLPYARILWGSQTAGAIEAGRTGHSDAAAARLAVCVNRMALQESNGIRWRLASDACTSYSTATSPRWAADGPACRAGGTHFGLPLCGPQRLARRARVANLGWSFFDARAPGLRGYIERWARGEVTFPAGTEYAVHTDQRSRRVTPDLHPVYYGSNVAWRRRIRGSVDPVLPVRIVPQEDACDTMNPGD